MAVRQLKDGRWICYYRINKEGKSQIKKEYFGRGVSGKAAAEKRNGELGLMKRRPAKPKKGPRFHELAKAYSENKDFSDNSKKHLHIRLKANILPFFGTKPALVLSHDDLNQYVRQRRQSKVKDATIVRELNDIIAILNWSIARSPPLIPYNPVQGYKKPKTDHDNIQPPTQDETARIIQHAAPHTIRAIFLSYYLGLRPGAVELLRLTWQDVNWESKTILVTSAKKGGSGSRSVPIHEDFLDILKEWSIKDDGHGPIIHYHNKPVRSIRNGWTLALERAKITRRIRPYDLRHSFITMALEQGADIKALSEIVGSKPATIMRHYQHVSSELRQKTVAKIPTLKAKKI